MDPVVIVGSGLSGFNVVKELRKLDTQTPVVMLTADDGRNYSKPMLSNGFTKGKSADELAMLTPEQVAEQYDIKVRTFTHVTAIDRDARVLELDNGERQAWSKLILAWGADVFRPPLEGDATDEVYSVNDLMDYGRFREQLEGKDRVLIMGGGLIGCEFANDLTNGGYTVEQVEPMGRCLPQLLPEPASQAVAEGLRELGVTLHFGPMVKEVNHGDGGKLAASLSDGSTVEADLVLSAVGLRPRKELAEQAGLKVNRGIMVDRHLRTSDPDIFALGDCAEVEGHVLPYVLPLMAAARSLAKTLASEETPVQYGVMPVTIKTPACPTVVLPPPENVDGEWECEADGLSVRALFRDAEGTLRGYALTGDHVKEKLQLNKEVPPLMA